MKIALCQMENKGSVQENLEGSLRAVREAASQHAGPDPFSGGSAHGVFSTVSGEGCVEIPGQDRLGDREGVL